MFIPQHFTLNKIIATFFVIKKKNNFIFLNHRMDKPKCGIHTVAAMMPPLTRIFDLKRFTNNSIRPTAIRSMKRGGASDREIATVSGHRDEKSLQHYFVVIVGWFSNLPLGFCMTNENRPLRHNLYFMSQPLI